MWRVHRVLVRDAMVTPQAQAHKRKYRQWQRETPMALWQLDLVGGIYLANSFRVTCDGAEISLHPGPIRALSPDGRPRSTPRNPSACPATPEPRAPGMSNME